jgi:trehalose 6-phosphate synthase
VAERRELIVVSNRGPVSFRRGESGERVVRRGGGGLVTALRSLVTHHNVTWIASAITDEDARVAEEAGGAPMEEHARDGSAYRLRLVAHERQAYDWFYNVVANPTLWFLQHYLWDLVHRPNLDRALHHAWENGYVTVNRAFADAVVQELARRPGAAVLIHDYHLYLAPAFVRRRVPEASISHFVHIPWPQPDYWHVLPEPIRAEIHRGLLAVDAVGFHSVRWQRNFLRCVEDFVPEAECWFEEGRIDLDGRTVRAHANPISVDPVEFDELAQSPRVRHAEEALLARRPEKLVLRVDRTDPSKNVVRGFQAFELYLAAHPEMHGRVQMLALLDPSRQDIPEYAEYLGAIQRAARAVNDRFQENGWEPIDLQIRDDFSQTVAAYKHFDVLLVNAIFDGLNLVAKEAPLVNERNGVVVLSENTGAYDELRPWAVGVNPFDLTGQAEAIHTALTMPAAERRERLEAIRALVRDRDLSVWIERELAVLTPGGAALPG